ncbi:hypothetical protein CC86DRAFT_414359, partial [Ophiobolus disseminans]
ELSLLGLTRKFPGICSLFFHLFLLFLVGLFLSLPFLLLLPLLFQPLSLNTLLFLKPLLEECIRSLDLLPLCLLEVFLQFILFLLSLSFTGSLEAPWRPPLCTFIVFTLLLQIKLPAMVLALLFCT